MAVNVTRREFLSASALGTGLSAVAAGNSPEYPKNTPLNVLFILVDQHRAECLGCYGNREIHTPNIDALAATGTRYPQTICAYPVCTPSRYSIISGLYVHQHRGYTNHCTLPPDADTFPRILRDAGYRTTAVGKMHYTPTYLDVGYQDMILAEQNGPGRWDDDYHRELQSAGLVNASDLEDQEKEFRDSARAAYWETFGALPSNLPLHWQSTEWIGRKSLEQVSQWEGGGHVLTCSFIKPHHPFDPPSSYAGAYDPEKLSLLPGWTDDCFEHDQALNTGYFPNKDLSPAKLRRIMAYYYANIQHIDDQVGRLVQALKNKGLYDQTMIIYTSDHGDYMGQHHMVLKANHMYESLSRVPLIIKYPGQTTGAVDDRLVSGVDLAPTILTQAGCESPAAMTGINLADPGATRDIVFSEHRNGHQLMARTHTHKLIIGQHNKLTLFYDFENDPGELNNLADRPEHRDEIKRLTEAIATWRPLDMWQTEYVNEDAPIIQQPNVPKRNDGHRDAILAYTRARMTNYWDA